MDCFSKGDGLLVVRWIFGYQRESVQCKHPQRQVVVIPQLQVSIFFVESLPQIIDILSVAITAAFIFFANPQSSTYRILIAGSR